MGAPRGLRLGGLRVENRETLTQELETAFLSWSSADLLAALEAATVPAGPINTIAQTFDDPQIKSRGIVITPEGVPGLRGPWVFSDSELATKKSAPILPRS